MATIATGLLIPPHVVAVSDDSAAKRSAFGTLPFAQKPDTQLLPRRFSLSWLNVTAAAADAITRQYDENPLTVITVTLAATGEQVRLQLIARPIVNWASAVFASSVTADAEETLAFES